MVRVRLQVRGAPSFRSDNGRRDSQELRPDERIRRRISNCNGNNGKNGNSGLGNKSDQRADIWGTGRRRQGAGLGRWEVFTASKLYKLERQRYSTCGQMCVVLVDLSVISACVICSPLRYNSGTMEVNVPPGVKNL